MNQPGACRLLLIAILLTVATSLGGGCGTSVQDHIPKVDDAQAALEAALTAWQGGAAINAPIEPAGKPGMVVILFDRDYAGGRKLMQWKVDSAEAAAEGPRQFKVTLTIDGDPQPAAVTYYVTGIQQKYSVFRDIDYQQRASEM